MAWIERHAKKGRTSSYWIRDRRNGREIVIPAGTTRAEAELALDRYVVRRDLEKEGYPDRFETIADDLFGIRLKETGNGMG